MDKVQRAGRDFLLRLVTQHGLRGGAGAGARSRRSARGVLRAAGTAEVG
jgi:hypothetical protein